MNYEMNATNTSWQILTVGARRAGVAGETATAFVDAVAVIITAISTLRRRMNVYSRHTRQESQLE